MCDPPTWEQASTGGMRSQLGVYRDLRDNLSEGLRFYMSVQEAIATLRQQAGDYILTRRLQRCLSPGHKSLIASCRARKRIHWFACLHQAAVCVPVSAPTCAGLHCQ